MRNILLFIFLILTSCALATPHNQLFNDPVDTSKHELHTPDFSAGTHAQRLAYPTGSLLVGDQWTESDSLQSFKWDGTKWWQIAAQSTQTYTWTFTITNTFTPTPTPTNTPTNTNTGTPTNTATKTFTATATVTNDATVPTSTFTNTATGTPTNTPTVTATYTFTSTSTNTQTVTATAMATATPILGIDVVLIGRDLSVNTSTVSFSGTRIHVAMTTSTSNPALNPGDMVSFADSNAETALAGGNLYPVVNVGTNYFECSYGGSPFVLTHAVADMVVYGSLSKNTQYIKDFWGGNAAESGVFIDFVNTQILPIFPRIADINFFQIGNTFTGNEMNMSSYGPYYSNNGIHFSPSSAIGSTTTMSGWFYIKFVNVQ